MTVSVTGISPPIDIFLKKIWPKEKDQLEVLQLKVINHKMRFKKDCGADRTGSEEDRRRGSARLEPGASSGAAALRANSPRLLSGDRAAPASELNSKKKSSAPTRHLSQRKRGELVMPRRVRRRRGGLTLSCRHQKQKAALAVGGKFRPLQKRRIPALG